MRWNQRLAMVIAGGLLAALLLTAARLTPSPYGMGTHQQLGLPPCTMIQWFGIRCPSCGMTTSWAHMVRGHILSSLRANSGGALLALAALASSPWLLLSGLRGRWLLVEPRDGVILGAGLTVVVVTIIDWTLRLSLGL